MGWGEDNMEKRDYEDVVDKLSEHLKKRENFVRELKINKEYDYRFHGKLWEQNQLARIQYEDEQIMHYQSRLDKYRDNKKVRQGHVGRWD